MDQGGGPQAGAQLNLIPGGPVLDLLGRQLSPQQAGVEQLPEDGQALLIPAAEGLHIPPLQPLAVQLFPQAGQHLGQLGGVDGFQDILRHPHAHRLPGVLKVVKAGKNHQPRPGQGLAQAAAQLQPVHEGHFYVGEHHIGPQLLGQLQGLLPVARLPHQREAQGAPVDFQADAGADLLLIVRQQDAVLLHSSLHSCAARH